MLDELYHKKINHFTYNGQSSLDYGILVENVNGIYGAPVPVLNVVNVPGRGNIIINSKPDELDNEQYEDSPRYYVVHTIPDVNSGQNLEVVARNLHKWLYSNVDYKVLTDTYEPNFFWKAYVSEQMSIEKIATGLMGKLTIPFMCKAFKYDIGGNDRITLTEAGIIYNTSGYTSYPLIRLYGSSEVNLFINDRIHVITIDDGYVDIDSERMCTFKGDTLKNHLTVMTHYPKLVSGDNRISWTGNLTKLEIIPRWCTL